MISEFLDGAHMNKFGLEKLLFEILKILIFFIVLSDNHVMIKLSFHVIIYEFQMDEGSKFIMIAETIYTNNRNFIFFEMIF